MIPQCQQRAMGHRGCKSHSKTCLVQESVSAIKRMICVFYMHAKRHILLNKCKAACMCLHM